MRQLFLVAVVGLSLTAPGIVMAEARIERNVVFGMYSGLALLMDVYHPEEPNGYGVVFISGSGWTRELDLDATPLKESGQEDLYAIPLAASGYTVFGINHRASPRFRHPAHLEDAQRAIRFVRHHAADYGINPQRIGAMGGSSGGHLVSLLGVMDGEGDPQDPSPVNRESAKAQAVVARAAPTDLSLSSGISPLLGFRLPGRPGSAEHRQMVDASPLTYVSADDPPFLLMHGDADATVSYENSEVMQAALQNAGVTVDLLRIRDAGHGPTFPGATNPPDYIGAMVAWFDRHLPPAPAGTIHRADPGFDALVPENAVIEKLADGFVFTEGPVWSQQDPRLIFSDVRGNTVYEWTETDGVTALIDPVFEGDRTGLRSISANGLTFDADGRLVLCEHGYRRISRLEADGRRTTLVDRYQGRRLNSPNDAVYSSDGWLYFTDPGSALEGRDESPLRELDFNGIYRLSPDGDLQLLYRDQARPNGIALSPDETTLYVADSGARLWMAYDLGEDGVSNPRVFRDVADQAGEGVPDGLKVDTAGNLFATGPGGVWVLSPDGVHLGTIMPTEVPANVAWGDDGHTLYMTARTGLYRIRLTTEGTIP